MGIGGKGSIVDDFMYGTNVAGAHVYIRMGKVNFIYHLFILKDNQVTLIQKLRVP